MEDTRWLRLITIGLVLAAMAIAYFLLTQRFSGSKTNKPASSPQIAVAPTGSPIPTGVLGINTVASPSASPQATQSGTLSMGATTKGGLPIAQLPSTGFPVDLLGVFAIGGAAAGWGLRKFPH